MPADAHMLRICIDINFDAMKFGDVNISTSLVGCECQGFLGWEADVHFCPDGRFFGRIILDIKHCVWIFYAIFC